MEEEQRLVWKLKVGVRFSSFNLKLNFQNRLSSWKLHRLSFLVRFRKHRLRIDSQSKPERLPATTKPKSKFTSLLHLFKRRKRRECHSCQSDRLVDSKDKLVWNRSLGLSLGVVTLIIIILSLIVRF